MGEGPRRCTCVVDAEAPAQQRLQALDLRQPAVLRPQPCQRLIAEHLRAPIRRLVPFRNAWLLTADKAVNPTYTEALKSPAPLSSTDVWLRWSTRTGAGRGDGARGGGRQAGCRRLDVGFVFGGGEVQGGQSVHQAVAPLLGEAEHHHRQLLPAPPAVPPRLKG